MKSLSQLLIENDHEDLYKEFVIKTHDIIYKDGSFFITLTLFSHHNDIEKHQDRTHLIFVHRNNSDLSRHYLIDTENYSFTTITEDNFFNLILKPQYIDSNKIYTQINKIHLEKKEYTKKVKQTKAIKALEDIIGELT